MEHVHESETKEVVEDDQFFESEPYDDNTAIEPEPEVLEDADFEVDSEGELIETSDSEFQDKKRRRKLRDNKKKSKKHVD